MASVLNQDEPAPEPAAARSRVRLHLLFIVVLTALFYARSIDNYWIKDDLAIGNFTRNGEISWELVEREFWPDYMKSEHYWRPIPLVPGYFENKFWGLNPAGYHIDNVLIHVLVAFLVYFLANRLTKGASATIGFAAATLFALSPINAEAVVWVMQRMVLICMLMSGCGLLCWLNAAEGRSPLWRIGGLLFLILALLSKEIALTLPGLYALLDFFWGPRERSAGARLKRAAVWAVPCALILVAYFVCRQIMWGQVVNTYAGLDPWEYAAQNRVFENFGLTLLHGTAPVNTGVFSEAAAGVLRGVMLACFSAAALRALVLWKFNETWRRTATFATAMIVLGLLPILPICWIDERLFNGRFFYQPAAGFLLLVSSSLLMPFKHGQLPSHFDAVVGRLTTGFLLVATAIALGGGLVAFDYGGEQVRAMQQAVVAYSDQLEEQGDRDATVVALYTPSQYEGVPTLEYSLELAVRPPLAHRRVSCIPLLDRDFLTAGKWADELEAAMDKRGIEPEALRWVECRSRAPEPLGIVPLFGAREPALGVPGIELVSPRDSSFLRNDGPEPSFSFRAPSAARTFRIRFQVRTVDYEWGPKLVPGTNCTRSADGVFTFKPSFRDPSQPELPDLWEKMMRVPLRHPVPMTWRVACYDQDGTLIALSPDFRCIVLNGIPWPDGAAPQ